MLHTIHNICVWWVYNICVHIFLYLYIDRYIHTTSKENIYVYDLRHREFTPSFPSQANSEIIVSFLSAGVRWDSLWPTYNLRKALEEQAHFLTVNMLEQHICHKCDLKNHFRIHMCIIRMTGKTSVASLQTFPVSPRNHVNTRTSGWKVSPTEPGSPGVPTPGDFLVHSVLTHNIKSKPTSYI